MSEPALRRSTLTLPGTLPHTDPLPHPNELIEGGFTLADDLPPAMHERARLDRPRSVHPSLQQDRYGRDRTELTLDTVVLDNGVLRATVVPGLGGRLWSLQEVRTGRELLYANGALQPANLALRNAWFAGGVEWNIGTKGHAAHTMAPVHAAQVTGPDGVPRLRLWEWDRLRGVAFQVDLWLPRGSAGLHVYVRIQNPGATAVPMYWWSNAAVPEAADVRVLAPAHSAFATAGAGPVRRVSVPRHDGADVTWSARSPKAADYFFDIADGELPWVAAVAGDGHGLLQVSSERLRGRKLFCWGASTGGAHWQDWLSPTGGRYLEIQAGLLPTQFEHVAMPAGTQWDWVEVYGDADADASVAHGEDWAAAVGHVGQAAARLLPDPDQTLAEARAVADCAPQERLGIGSGWGALEVMAAAHGRRDLAVAPGTPFTRDMLDGDSAPWAAMLEDPSAASPALADADPGRPPASYVSGAHWEVALGDVEPCWARDYHLGVLAHSRGALHEAESWYLSSLEHAPTAWALRGVAQLAAERGERDQALDLFVSAWQSEGVLGSATERTVLIEAMTAALAAGRPAVALEVAEQASGRVRALGRVRLLRARAAWSEGSAAGAALTRSLLREGIEVPDLREGERELSDLWLAAFPEDPVPASYDYRMF
ncbi:DUF5107 domain-containing protein [Ruania halotolerans]|uniref:DUF5107 domain-containing protein n=1 Tax=Ruania halotolerans TaxID=2897773 RepID=UPI001E5CE3A1|nr:DUF5107 domain-containing protein [Ruania halotolerans]UFU05089.1 DUF5107 domain-containing protein [Ruania halotolerans]